ncbi:DUF982 domain-containing protein [Mesorhizobium sp. INR15]|uniref:DUF982 domain-containing protein n=1 Tax=Mesorhizobium sp. INR15 TaxID=2654248 RepID=UPI00215605BD|nr:DUF982 domain-containing protein [Mesorhizobium sp. INR15]
MWEFIQFEAAHPMYDAWFSKPISVATGISGDIRNLNNARQAFDLLNDHWRSGESDKHRSAKRACQQALNGSVSADVARDAFIDAAREAHMLVE